MLRGGGAGGTEDTLLPALRRNCTDLYLSENKFQIITKWDEQQRQRPEAEVALAGKSLAGRWQAAVGAPVPASSDQRLLEKAVRGALCFPVVG